jgi:hypothetical protein
MLLRQGLVAGSCEPGNEPSCSMKGGRFLVQLSSYQVLIKLGPWS